MDRPELEAASAHLEAYLRLGALEVEQDVYLFVSPTQLMVSSACWSSVDGQVPARLTRRIVAGPATYSCYDCYA